LQNGSAYLSLLSLSRLRSTPGRWDPARTNVHPKI